MTDIKLKFHFIYKTTLLCGHLAGKYYLGKHTGYLTDGYAGSGKILKDYFKKYGKKKNKTYIRELLEFNGSKEENAIREKEIIGDKWKTDPNCINCCEGGICGGLSFIPWNKGKKGCFSSETIEKMSNAKKGKPSPYKGVHGRYTEETLSKMSSASKGRKHTEQWKKEISERQKGHTVSKETRKKISEKATGRKWSEKAKNSIMVPILQYTKNGEFVKEWHGATEVENKLGISHKKIWKGLNGYSKFPGGFMWKYKEGTND